jgi:FkbM family methyltransferase
MQKISTLLSMGLLSAQSVFGTLNEKCFDGACEFWGTAETVSARLKLVEHFIPENPIVFEAGAHDGTDSVILSKFWPNGTIISFEANPNQFKSYQGKAKLHKNMSGYNLALNSFKGAADFYVCRGAKGDKSEFEGSSSLLKPSKALEAECKGPVIKVPCVVLDDWCKENKVKNIDFIWIDLEGFEKQFIESSPTVFSTVGVIYVATNFTDFRQGATQFSDLKALLAKQGFEMIAHWYNEGMHGDAIFVKKSKL